MESIAEKLIALTDRVRQTPIYLTITIGVVVAWFALVALQPAVACLVAGVGVGYLLAHKGSEQ